MELRRAGREARLARHIPGGFRISRGCYEEAVGDERARLPRAGLRRDGAGSVGPRDRRAGRRGRLQPRRVQWLQDPCRLLSHTGSPIDDSLGGGVAHDVVEVPYHARESGLPRNRHAGSPDRIDQRARPVARLPLRLGRQGLGHAGNGQSGAIVPVYRGRPPCCDRDA